MEQLLIFDELISPRVSKKKTCSGKRRCVVTLVNVIQQCQVLRTGSIEQLEFALLQAGWCWSSITLCSWTVYSVSEVI
jgi:hypothetical protein